MADKLSERLERIVRAPGIANHPAYTDAIREAAELARRVEWQPIETAPTNEWVLVLDGIGDVCAAHQQFGYWYAWFDYVGEDLKLTEVTHWRPMPERPEARRNSDA